MPELPEVETIKRELARILVGKKIKTFQSDKFHLPNLVGRKIEKVERRAKILVFSLDDGKFLLIHLKLTGQLIFNPKEKPRFVRAIFTFIDKSKLFFNDLRKFGWLKIVNETELQKLREKTGVEPLSKDFTLAKFTEILAHYPKRKIKQFLLDQTLIAGLGNIYADESCFSANILPTRIIKSLAPNEIKKLQQTIIKVLKLAIKKKGTSARDYLRSNGAPGNFVPLLNVYGRAGEICKICGSEIKKIKLNGRGTHYCPKCQK